MRGVGGSAKAALDGGDVAEPEQATAGLDADLANALDRREVARDANAHAVGRRLVEAGRGHRVLLLQRVDDRQRIEPERRQLGVRDLDVDLFFLDADQLDFLDVGHLPQFAGDAIGLVAQRGEIEAVAGQGIDGDEGFAELVVDERPLHAGGRVWRMSPIFLRTWYQASGTSFFGV